MTATSFTTAFWDVEDSGRVQAVQIRSRVVGTDAWSVVAERADPAAGQLTFTSDGADLDLEVQIRYRMTSSVYGDWVGANIHTAPAPGSYPALEGKPSKLGDINSGEGGKLQGIEAGADVTGTHTSKDTANVGGVPTTTFVNKVTLAESNISKLQSDFKTTNEENVRQFGLANTKIDGVASDVSAKIGSTGTITTSLASVSQKTDKTSADLTTEVKQRTDAVTAVNARIDTITAQGTNGTDTFARSEIQRVETAYIDADKAFAQADQTLRTDFTNLNTATNTKFDQSTKLLSDSLGAIGSRQTNLEASASAASGSVVFNDNFAYWPDGQGLPSRWGYWAAQGNFRAERLSPGRGGGLYCVRTFNDVANVESGFVQTIYTAGPGKWVAEVTVDMPNGSLQGSGVTLHGVWNIDFCADPDTNGRVGDSNPGDIRSWSKMFDIDARDQINVHAMHGWTGFGRTIMPKTITWHCLRLRPATDGEIKAGKADNDLNKAGGIVARLSTVETVTTNGTFAGASRANTLEAQMRREIPSALNSYGDYLDNRVTQVNSNLSSRISTVESVTTNGTFATASVVNQLRTEYNKTVGDLTTVSSVASDAYGRSRAFLQQTAVAGNNRAQITLYADSNGGAGVDIIGDVTFRGSLSVGTGRSGARTEITDGGMRVFDSNNVLRVVLGVF